MNQLSINQLLEKPIENTNNYFEFYDWFCKTETLSSRFDKLIPKLRFLVSEGLINGDTHYVWFKNNCPLDGSLYDDIRISTLDENNNFKGGFCPKSGHSSDTNKASFWLLNTKEGMDIEEQKFLNWSSMKKELKTNEELRKKIISHYA